MNTNLKVGDLVTKSKDWAYGAQADGAVFGEVTGTEIAKEFDDNYWIKVKWVDLKGNVITENSYRIGPLQHDVEIYSED